MNLALLLHDAHMLAQQYRDRNKRDMTLTTEELKAWDAESALTLEAIVHFATPIAQQLSESSGDEVSLEWFRQMRARKRVPTYKPAATP